MGKRSNELGQVRKEDYESKSSQNSVAPKGPFQKASDEVLQRRRIVKARKDTLAGKTTCDSSSSTLPANPFSKFSFGNSTTPALVPVTQYPSFAEPSTADTTQKSRSVTLTTNTNKKNSNVVATCTATDEEKIECAESFRKHILESGPFIDIVALNRFVIRYRTFWDKDSPDSSKTVSWDSNRSLFPTNSSKLKSQTSMTPSAPSLVGGSTIVPSPKLATAPTETGSGFSFFTTPPALAPVPASNGGFSFSLSNTGVKSPATAQAFSFSSTQTPEVKKAAAAAAVPSTASFGTSNLEDSNTNDDNEETTDLESADDDYDVIYSCPTKILQVTTNKYVAKGKLKLEHHKESKKYRVVVRDKTVGRVQFNVAITHGMPLEKKTLQPPSNKKNGKPVHIIIINTIFEEGGQPQVFKIVTTVDDHETLYTALKKVVE